MLLLDPAGCYPGRGAAVYDTDSFADALAAPGTSAATIVQSVTLGAPAHGHGGAAALRKLYLSPPLARPLAFGGCPGVVFNFNGLRGSTVVAGGGQLRFDAPLLLLGLYAAPIERAAAAGAAAAGARNNDTLCTSTLPSTPTPLFKAVRLERGGVLLLQGAHLAAFQAAELAAQLKSDGAVNLVVAAGGDDIAINGSIPTPSGGGRAAARPWGDLTQQRK
jgi:hypothetical protein